MVFRCGMAIPAVMILFLAAGCGTDEVSRCKADVDGDGRSDLLLIRGGRRDRRIPSGEAWGDTLEVRLGNGKKLVFPLEALRPLQVQAGDVDGDGRADISLKVYKTAVFHSQEAKRPFFFRLEGGELKPLWLGSRFSKPFDDYRLFDLDGDGTAEIISIEWLESGSRVLTLYRWQGFGFEWICESKAFPEGIRFVTPGRGGEKELVVISAGEKKRLRYDGKFHYLLSLFQN